MMIHDFNLFEFVALARRIGSDTADVEVKTAAAGLPKDVVESLSAFANKSGGVVICGLSEKEGFRVAEGFDAQKISNALAQACADKMEPPVLADIEIREFEGGLIVVAYVPETAPYAKPCYVKARGLYEGAYIRTGEGDRKLSRYEIDRLEEESTQPRFDGRLVDGASLKDLDHELVEGFLRRERAASPRVFAGLSDEDALLTMNVLCKIDEEGTLGVTLAGLMAFSRHPQQFYPRANVTFAVFPGTSKEDLSTDGARFLDSKTIIGPIPVMVAETLAQVRKNMRVRSFVEGGARRDVEEYPEVAVREAVANALMHRDYSPEGLGSQVQVNMYADRLEVVNPGGLYGMVTVDTIGQYGASSSRNQYLSRILESTPYPYDVPETGYVVENKGTGFAQIQATLKRYSMLPAEPIDDLGAFALVIYNQARPSEEGEVASSSGELAQIENAVITLLAGEESLSSSEVASALQVSASTARRHLKGLIASGRVEQVGKTRGARYRLVR